MSITVEADFCVDALEQALVKHGRPEIFNTHQGSQFTSETFAGELTKNGVAIRMDGKGSWRDNVLVECFWRNLKDDEVYLRAYKRTSATRALRSAAIWSSTI
jgi:putative transposase